MFSGSNHWPLSWTRIIFSASIYQPTNAHIISHKTLLNILKHSDMFRSCQIIIRELCSLLKLYYSIHNSIHICKRGVVAAYHVVLWSSGWVCVVCWVIRDSHYSAYDAHPATAPQHIPTQYDMLPQHLVCKYELNCEYCNITSERNKAPWWWCDKIETCRSVLKCLKVFYVKLYVHSLVDKLKWFYENARCYNKIYNLLHILRIS